MAVHRGVEKRWISREKGYGLFATVDIPRRSLVVFDTGRVVTEKEYLSFTLTQKRGTYQIDARTFLAPHNFDNPNLELLVNNSCNPNLFHAGRGLWLAWRRIKAGEEITCDYVVFQTNEYGEYDTYTCLCGSKNCRGRLSGDDWKKRELQERYQGQFFPSVQRLIDQEGY